MGFDNYEELDVDLYNRDFEYLFDSNKTKVIVVSKTKDSKDNLQGDFLGITTTTFKDKIDYTFMSINTDAKKKRELMKQGYVNEGQTTYKAYIKKDDFDRLQLTNQDIVLYDRFKLKVELETQAEKSGRLAFVELNLISIGLVAADIQSGILPGYLLVDEGGKLIL